MGPVHRPQGRWADLLQPHALWFWGIVGRSRQGILRRGTRQLLNNAAEIVLADVVNLRLRLLPGSIIWVVVVVGGSSVVVVVIVIGKIRLV